MILRKKLHGYIRLLAHKHSQFIHDRRRKNEQRVFRTWLSEFCKSDASLILGANFNTSGGVRNHILAIYQHTSLKTLLAPGDHYLLRYGTSPFSANSDCFLATLPPRNAFAVHTHVLPWLIDWAKLHRSSHLRWLHTHHNFYYPSKTQPQLEPWQTHLNKVILEAAQSCDVPLTVSRWQKKYLKENFDLDAYYLPNGVDVKKCDSAVPANFLKKHGLTKPFILWVGSTDPVKNPGPFIHAACELSSINFVMLGGISEKFIHDNFKIEKPSNLTLLSSLPHGETLDAISACSLLVVTSHREGLPTLVLEGMALRKPIVIPDEDGCMDATDGEQHATIYSKDNPHSIVEAIEKTMEEKVRRDSREKVLSQYDWRIVSKKLDMLYQGTSPREICD